LAASEHLLPVPLAEMLPGLAEMRLPGIGQHPFFRFPFPTPPFVFAVDSCSAFSHIPFWRTFRKGVFAPPPPPARDPDPDPDPDPIPDPIPDPVLM